MTSPRITSAMSRLASYRLVLEIARAGLNIAYRPGTSGKRRAALVKEVRAAIEVALDDARLDVGIPAPPVRNRPDRHRSAKNPRWGEHARAELRAKLGLRRAGRLSAYDNRRLDTALEKENKVKPSTNWI